MLLVVCVLALFVCHGSQPEEAHAYSRVDAAIDYHGLPYVFHFIAWRESHDNPFAVNEWSGACGPFQFLPSTAWNMQYIPTSSRFGNGYGYTCAELTNPYTAALAAKELWWVSGLSPWGY